MANRIDKRIAVGWLIALSALWTILTFGFHVKRAILWVMLVAVAVLFNGFIATHLDNDGG